MTGPLAGVRVVELAGIGPAPYAALLLAELGADVVRVDRPGALPFLATGDGLGRSRPSIAVDLKSPDGAGVLRRLLDTADVLLEGWRPGVLERLGFAPSELRTAYPRLVIGRMTGWGQDGPWAQRAGHDITYAALSGALHTVGSADKPRQAVNYLADFGGGSLFLVAGVLAGLVQRGVSGQGCVVDAAMVDGAASLTTMLHGLLGAGLWQDAREGNLLDGGAPFYDTYRCADGGFVAVGPLEPQFYAVFVELLGTADECPVEEQYDVSTWERQREAFATTFAREPRAHWEAVFEGSDACVAPVLSLDEVASHPHLAARSVIEQGRPRVAPRFSSDGVSYAVPPAPGAVRPVGADTTAYLLTCGFTEDEVTALVASGAVAQS